jgi:anaerobic magnesium-protoporphyrin IX monomethyl ester cyclase
LNKLTFLLVIPPSPFLLDDRAFPFLGPLQIAALARREGHEALVADLTGYKQRHPEVIHAEYEPVMEEAEQMLLRAAKHADVVGFYSLAAQHPQVVKLNASVRAAYPNVITALGGPHANTAPGRCLEDDFDYIVVSDQGGGGGEAGFLELVRRVVSTGKKRPARNSGKRAMRVMKDNCEVDGAWKHDPRIINKPSRIGVEWENDQWPLPARDLIDLNSYHYSIEGERSTSIVSATGCPFACTFCSHWNGYRKLEAKSSKRVAEEIEHIKREYGFRGIMFYDDEINLRPDFYDSFLPMLTKQNIVWRAFFKNGRTLTTEKVFEAMAASGCVSICTGAESADAGILKGIKKGATLEDNTNFIKYAIKHGIKPKVFTQVGLPGETPETIKALRDWLVRMSNEGLADADVSITTPYEGTPLYESPEKFDIQFDKSELNYAKDVVLYKGVPGEYKSYVWHKNLTRRDLVDARQWVEDEFRSAAGLKPLLAKDDG